MKVWFSVRFGVIILLLSVAVKRASRCGGGLVKSSGTNSRSASKFFSQFQTLISSYSLLNGILLFDVLHHRIQDQTGL